MRRRRDNSGTGLQFFLLCTDMHCSSRSHERRGMARSELTTPHGAAFCSLSNIANVSFRATDVSHAAYGVPGPDDAQEAARIGLASLASRVTKCVTLHSLASLEQRPLSVGYPRTTRTPLSRP